MPGRLQELYQVLRGQGCGLRVHQRVRIHQCVRHQIGVEPGSVTPFAAINDSAGRVTVVLDAAMMAHEALNFHPLVNTATTTISRDGLRKFLAATGHPPRVEAVSGAAAAEP